ncbi:MFS transporter [Flavobacterium ajazii]|uniref:MFS transporter n=1 Tax=Flavobacterium ajazii TaxID=2692318 RepID=UPI0013D13932|nr:MFS transporter [Flavobacterium ajazii]
MSTAKKSIYSLQFIMLCFSSLFFASSFTMIIPELPAYLSSLGGAQYKGLIVSLFTLTAAVSRPFSGKFTDRLGRVPMMILGSFFCLVSAFLYPIFSSVFGFLFLRLIHGFSTGFRPTASLAYAADITPKERWGEALGVHGLFFSLGICLGPSAGGILTKAYGVDVMFYSSAFLAFLSTIIVINLKETLSVKQEFGKDMLCLKRSDILYRAALPAGIVTFFSYTAHGLIQTLIPDWSIQLGLHNKGFFFTVFSGASILVRYTAGKISDRKGRTHVIVAGLIAKMAGLFVISESQDISVLLIGAAVYGTGAGLISAAIGAWTIELSEPQFRGKAIATMYICMELGIGLGALVGGVYYQGEITRIPEIIRFDILVILLGLLYIIYLKKYKTSFRFLK